METIWNGMWIPYSFSTMEWIPKNIDSSIWREEIQNRNRLLDLAGRMKNALSSGSQKLPEDKSNQSKGGPKPRREINLLLIALAEPSSFTILLY
jgi:hypothetical protein